MNTTQNSNIQDNTAPNDKSAPVYDSVINNIVVAALYKFTRFAQFRQLYREPILDTMLDNDVKGTLLIAAVVSINGTISGTRQGIDNVLEYLRSIEAIGSFTFKESYTNAQPFDPTKVKLKKEIVTMGAERTLIRYSPLVVNVKPRECKAHEFHTETLSSLIHETIMK